MTDMNVQAAVQEKYGAIAKAVGQHGCCGPTPCGCGDPITSNLHSEAETHACRRMPSPCPSDAAIRPPSSS